MTVYLLDVNVLLALCDSLHVHHEAAHRWFGDYGRTAWATCPITENVTVHRHPVTPVGASLLAIHSDGTQGGDFTARRGIREQARSYRAFFRR